MLELKNIRKSFGKNIILKNVSLSINNGEIVSILGPSGSGKTTLLNLILGITDIENGNLILDGKDITKVPMEKRGFNIVFQDYALFPNLNAYENITYGLRNKPNISSKEEVDDLIKLLGLEEHLNKNINQLSGGQKQRVALARTMVMKPKILLLDEPLSAIDAKLRKNLQIEIRRIQQELNITTIFVTHDQDEAMSMSDRICLLNNGNIEQVSSPIELYTKPKTRFAASFIGHYNVFSPDEFKQAFHVAAPDNKMTAIRPETIQISTEKPQENDAIHTIYGKIINNRSVGNTLHYHIDVNGITFKVDTLFRSFALYKNDQNVWLSLEKRNCLALED